MTDDAWYVEWVGVRTICSTLRPCYCHASTACWHLSLPGCFRYGVDTDCIAVCAPGRLPPVGSISLISGTNCWQGWLAPPTTPCAVSLSSCFRICMQQQVNLFFKVSILLTQVVTQAAAEYGQGTAALVLHVPTCCKPLFNAGSTQAVQSWFMQAYLGHNVSHILRSDRWVTLNHTERRPNASHNEVRETHAGDGVC
jgi:hypothetical protein